MKLADLASIQDVELDIFDEDDWSFLKSDESNEHTFFSDIEDIGVFDSTVHKSGGVLKGVFIGVSIVCFVIMGYTAVATIKSTSTYKLLEEMNASTKVTEIRIAKQDYVDGEEITSNEFMAISRVLNEYFSKLRVGGSLENLHEQVLGGSTLAYTEESYRANVKYSFDSNDGYARALKQFSQLVDLKRVEKILIKDDEYYAYITLSSTDVDGLYDYYMKYATDLKRHFNVYPVNSINITKFMLSLVESNGVPKVNREYLLKVDKTSTGYKIKNDVLVQDLSTAPYIESISLITSILGESIS